MAELYQQYDISDDRREIDATCARSSHIRPTASRHPAPATAATAEDRRLAAQPTTPGASLDLLRNKTR